MNMKFEIGSKVAYSVQWLEACGLCHSDLARARGIVLELIPLGSREIARVDWADDDIPARVATDNLALVGPNTRFCKC